MKVRFVFLFLSKYLVRPWNLVFHRSIVLFNLIWKVGSHLKGSNANLNNPRLDSWDEEEFFLEVHWTMVTGSNQSEQSSQHLSKNLFSS